MEENKELPKKIDGRSSNGGHSTKGGNGKRGAGRPPKITERKLRAIAMDAIKKEFGSEDKMWREVAKKAKDGSFPHLQKLLEYNYGKPKEYKEVDIKQTVNIPIASFIEDDIIDITPNPEELNE